MHNNSKHDLKKAEFFRLSEENHYVRIDAEDKVTGHGQFVGDIMFADMLTGKIVRSPYARARIKSIDVSQAKAIPGVKCILTAKDFQWNHKLGYSELISEFADKEVLCRDVVRQIGDEVAVVGAIDEETAQIAADLIHVEYEVLEGVYDPVAAMREGAIEVNWEGNGLHNIGMESKMMAGHDIDEELENAYYTQHCQYQTHRNVHGALEPHGAVATFRNGIFKIWLSTQLTNNEQYWYAQCLGVDEDHVQIIKPLVGGSFGGKIDSYSFGLCAAKMAEITGRPVRIILTREEVFQTTRTRHPMSIEIDTAFDKEGQLLAKKSFQLLDGGAYGGSGIEACAQATLWANLPYKFHSMDCISQRVYTNNPTAGAMRGYTSCQVHFAHDLNMQYASDHLGIDPIEFRKMNAVDSGYVSPTGLTITSSAYKETLDTAAREMDWYKKKDQLCEGEGIGFAGTGFVSGAGFAVLEAPGHGFSYVSVRLNKRGIATVYIGSHDIAQGSDTVMSAIVAEELGVDMNKVKIFLADTYSDSWDTGTYGSPATFLVGNAVRSAAIHAKHQLFETIASYWNVDIQSLECFRGKVIHMDQTDLQMSLNDAILKYMNAHGGGELIGIGSYSSDQDHLQYAHMKASDQNLAYSFSTAATHLYVDKETGVLDIDEIMIAHDCGRVLNRRGVEGQLEGAIAMGLGYAIYEQCITRDGKILNSNFCDYHIPTALDMPKMKLFYDFNSDEESSLPAKEAGESSIAPIAPAIANAVNKATGIYFTKLPLDPESIWRKLNAEVESLTDENCLKER